MWMETAIVVDHQQTARLPAGVDHSLGVSQLRRDRFLAKDRPHATGGTCFDKLSMARREGGDTDNIQSLAFEHLPPVVKGAGTGSLFKSVPPPNVTARARD